MKKKKITKRKGYRDGTSLIENWNSNTGTQNAAGVAQGVGALGTMFSNATSGQQVTAAGVLTGVASGAASGAAMGGVPGAIVGGVLGGITSGMGTGGSVNEQTGDVTGPSGIAGMFGHSKSYLRNKGARIKNGIQSRQNAQQIAADYYMNNGYNETTMAAKGGIIPTTKARLSKGELLRDSDGIHEIPGSNGYANGEDDVLAQVEVGSQVLSNKLKVPGTNKTYAQMGKKMIKPNKKASDKYAQGTIDANQKMYNILLGMQEANKDGETSTEGYKNGTPEVPLSRAARRRAGLTVTTPEPISMNNYSNYGLGNLAKTLPQYKNAIAPGKINKAVLPPTVRSKGGGGVDLGGVLNSAAALAPGLANLNVSKPEVVDTYTYQPKYGPSTYDISDILGEIDYSDAIARYNQSRINPNTGAGMAFGLQSAVNRNKSIRDAYTQKRNAESQYAMQNAGIYNQWGNQYADARHQAAVEQAQNDAAYRSTINKGVSDLSTTLQSMRRDQRLNAKDMIMMDMMRPFLGKGMTASDLQSIYNKINSLY